MTSASPPGSAGGESGHGMIDWDLAVATGTRLTRPGPAVTPEEARAAVAQLREHAAEARGHVLAVTGLDASGTESSVAVIDRAGWVRANAAGFRSVIEPVVAELAARKATARKHPAKPSPLGSRITAIETGGLLAFLAGRVLGQYELFPPYGEESTAGRLLLVAPNIVAAERDMHLDPRDFRLWVCVHEETHRVQFGAVPWLRDHLMTQIKEFLAGTDVDPAVLLRRLRSALGVFGEAVRGSAAHPGQTGSLLDVVQTPEQREVLERVTALMSLLEGHADHVMDAVGPDVIPSVERIRARFQKRRQGAGRVDQLLRRLLGLDAKMRQYRDGARFVGGVVDRVGMEGFNRVWDSPGTLPLPAEILDPDAWVTRVLRGGAVGALPA